MTGAIMTKEELWQATLAQLQFQISQANFATWLKNTYILAKKGGEIVVSVPNNFSKEWLENKYNKLIFKIIRNLDTEVREANYAVERGATAKEAAAPTPLAEEETELGFQALLVDKATNLTSRYNFDNFVVGPFNELAHAATLAVTKNPGSVYNPLFIYGGTGLGKTHLLQASGNRVGQDFSDKKVRYVSSERFTTGVVSAIRNHNMDSFRASYRDLDVLILDDVQFLAGKDKTQEELFHTFNTLYERGKQIIFSSDRPPKAIAALEERLRSRFEGGMIADISAPDFETRLAILKQKLGGKNIELDQDVLAYIATHMQKNVRELEGALNRVIAFSQVYNKVPDLKETKNILTTYLNAPYRKTSPQVILKAVADFYNISASDLLKRSRKKEVVKPRQVAMFLLRDRSELSFPEIGQKLGGRDH